MLLISRLAVCAFFVWAASAPAEAQPLLLKTEASEKLLSSGRDHLLAYRMAEAERDLRLLSQRPDGRPAAYYFLSSAALHRALMTDREEHFKTFHGRSDTLKQILQRLEASTWRSFMRAEIDLFDSIALTKQNSYVRAALSARSAFNGYERLIKRSPEFYDAYRGMGMLHLAIGSMPSTFRFILKILGFSGTVTQALRELETAHRRSIYNREDAAIYLALMHTMLFIDEEEGLRIMHSVYQSHPESILFAHFYGFLLVSNRRAAEAERVYRQAISRAESGRYFYIDYMDFYLAEALFRQDRFAEAERSYRQYLNRHAGPALKALANLGLGQALEMQNKRQEALIFYRKVQAAREFDTDTAARRAAERLVSAPMSATDRRLLLARNAYDSSRYEEAEKALEAIVEERQISMAAKAEAAYRLGRVFHATGRLEESVSWYEKGIAWTEDKVSRWPAWGLFFIGEVRREQGRLEEARESYRAALAYPGNYDYHQALEQSAKVGLELMDAPGGLGR